MARRLFFRSTSSIVPPSADTTPPTVPTNVTASSVTSTGFVLSWTASTDAVGVTGYVVQIDGVTYATPTPTTVTVTGRSGSSTYSVRVQAVDAAGNFSALSTAINVTTSAAADVTAPTVPANVAASSVTTSGFTVSWSASTDAVGVTGYAVLLGGVQYGTTAGTSLAVTGRAASAAYSVQVQAFDAAGNTSVPSTAINVTTSAAADVTAPTVPTGVTASSVTSSGFTVSWTASTDAVGVTGYDVQIDGVSYATPTTTSVAVTGRAASTAYSVRVRARDAAGNFSALSTAITATTAAPASTVSLYTTQTPATADANDGQGLTVGNLITSDVDGSITGVRMYRATTAPSSAVGLLFDNNTGTELARATFGTLSPGWNTVNFGTPVGITAGTKYRVACWSSGPYVATGGVQFPVVNGHLSLSDSYYLYGASPAFPSNSTTSGTAVGSFYFADVLLSVGAAATVPATPAAPSVSSADASLLVTWVAPANGGSAITGYDVQPFAGATGGTVVSVGNVTSATVSGLTNGTAYTVKVRAKNAVGSGAYSAASAPATPAALASNITHGEQLTINHVGPWTLQGVAKGSESLLTPSTPSRGYWLMDTPSEWAPTGAYVYNNNASNKGGIVPAGGMTIDGYSVPAGTVVAQFRDFSASDFSAQGQAGQYLFRGCRFRNAAIGQSSQFNDFTATYTNRLFYCDMGSTGPTDAAWQGAFWKAIGGTGHIVHRNYFSYQYVTFQPNVPNCQFIENYVEKLIYYGGEAGPAGNGGPLHMACLGSEGGGSGYRVMRNKIIPASPDEGGHVFINGSSIAFEGTNGGAYTNCQVVDNYLSGFNYVILDFGEVAGSTGIVVTGNKVTTQWWTNGGASGVEQVGPNPPAWGSNGNVRSGNVWADDYGTGGTGSGTALSARQYPTGNGPRAGTPAFGT